MPLLSGSMLLYLLSIRMLVISLAHLFSSRHIAAAFSGLMVTCLALASGYAIHADDLSVWTAFLRFASPQYWMSHPIAQGEFEPVGVFRCTGNPVITENSIIKQVPCGLPSGKMAVRYFDYLPKFPSESVLADQVPQLVTVAFYVVFQILAFVFFLGKRQISKMSRSKKNKM